MPNSKRHYYLVSGHVTGHIKFENNNKIQDEVNTFPVQAFIATDKEDIIPVRYIARAQKALKESYLSRLPEGDDVIHNILDVQVHNLVDLGHMTEEEFWEGVERSSADS